jgi:dTDP-4-amino-4,6-dideoxygalactose transaminase
LPYLEKCKTARQTHAKFYSEHLQEIVQAIPVVQPWSTHVYYVYVIQVQERDAFRRALEQEGISTSIHYPIPIHLQPACAHYGYARGTLPVTEAVTEQIVSLPMYPELTTEQLQEVVNAVKKSIVLGASSL